MKTKIIFFSLVIVLIVSCGGPKKETTEVPNWVNNPYADLNRENYYAAVGSGVNLSRAEIEAKEKIWQIIISDMSAKEKLWSDLVNINKKIKLGVKETELNDFDNAELAKQNMLLDKKFTDEKTGEHYALIIMDRAKTAKLFEEVIADNNSFIYSFYQKYHNVKGKFRKLRNLQKAIELAGDTEYLNLQLKTISPNNQNVSLKIRTRTLLDERENYTNTIKIKLNLNGSYAKSLDNFLTNLCNNVGFSIQGGHKVYLDFVIDANLTMKQIDKDNPQKRVKWELFITITQPETGKKVIFSRDGVVSHMSIKEAQIAGLHDIRKIIYRHFYNFFIYNFEK